MQRPSAEQVLERMRSVAAEVTAGRISNLPQAPAGRISNLPQAPAGLVSLPRAAAGGGLMMHPPPSRLQTATDAHAEPQQSAFMGASSAGASSARAVADISFNLPDLPGLPDPADLPDAPDLLDLPGLPEPPGLSNLRASSAGGSSSGSPSRCSSLQPPPSWGSSSGGSGDDQEASWTWSLDLPVVPEMPSAAATGGGAAIPQQRRALPAVAAGRLHSTPSGAVLPLQQRRCCVPLPASPVTGPTPDTPPRHATGDGPHQQQLPYSLRRELTYPRCAPHPEAASRTAAMMSSWACPWRSGCS